MAAVIGGLLALPAVEILGVSVTTPIVSAAISPFLVDLSNAVNSAQPNVALSPQEVAVAVTRTAMYVGDGKEEARKSGINGDRFDLLLAITGNPPAPQQMAEALRRGFVTDEEYIKGIEKGDLRNEYAGVIKQLATMQASPAEVLTAAVEGQLDVDRARDEFRAVGGDPKDFDWRLGTVGSAPSPVEAYNMAARGVIPWTGTGEGVVSFEQAVKEGHSRNKWLPVYQAALAPIPPPRTITAMYKEGAFTAAEATKYFGMHGMHPDLIAAYLRAATATKTAHVKELAETTILALYEDKIIDRPTALGFVQRLGWSAPEAEYQLEVADFRAEAAALRSAVGHVHTLFVGHKIDATAAGGWLAQFGVPADRAKALLEIWVHERTANVKILTEAQVVAAWGHAITSTAVALDQLSKLGYDAEDSQTLLAIHNKGPLTPAQIAGDSGST